MVADASANSELLTTDQVCDRLAGEPALRSVAALCVLPMVPADDGGVRFRRADLDVWVARERAALAGRSRTMDVLRRTNSDDHEEPAT